MEAGNPTGVNYESGRAIMRLKQFPEIPRDVRQMD